MSTTNPPKGSVILRIIIVILIGVLIYVLYEPYQIYQQENYYKAESRLRMENLRTAELQYISAFGKYSGSSDSLALWVKERLADGTLRAEIFKPLSDGTFVPESLARAPKSWKPYMITTVDTTVIKKYLMECPDGYGVIGSLTDEEKLNKASWEL